MAVDDFRNAGISSQGLTNNNAGNIRPSGITPWMGQVGVSQNNFCIFSDVAWSIRAWLINFFSSVNNHGTTTLSSYITRYAPPSDNNNTAAYIQNMATATGLDPNAVMPLDNATVQQIMQAQFAIELGAQYANMLSQEDYDAGFSRYGNPSGSIVCAITISVQSYPYQIFGAASILLMGAGLATWAIWKIKSRGKK